MEAEGVADEKLFLRFCNTSLLYRVNPQRARTAHDQPHTKGRALSQTVAVQELGKHNLFSGLSLTSGTSPRRASRRGTPLTSASAGAGKCGNRGMG
jgi:hypothetical protein